MEKNLAGIRVIITVEHASPESAMQMMQDWSSLCDAVRQEPGCQQFELYRSATDPCRVALLEAWDTNEHYDAHHQQQFERLRRGEFPPFPEDVVVELYRQQTYLPVDGVWQARDPQDRLTSVILV